MLIIEDIILALFVALGIWQVLVPMFTDRPIFPIFRRSAHLAEAKRKKAAADLELEALSIEAETERAHEEWKKRHPHGTVPQEPATAQAEPTTSTRSADDPPATVPSKNGEPHVR